MYKSIYMYIYVYIYMYIHICKYVNTYSTGYEHIDFEAESGKYFPKGICMYTYVYLYSSSYALITLLLNPNYTLIASSLYTTMYTIPQGSQLSDVAWHGWTCTYGWPVQGIWPKALGGKSGLDGGGQDSDPYAVHRSHDEKLLVAGIICIYVLVH
jgi:hypothetical protein